MYSKLQKPVKTANPAVKMVAEREDGFMYKCMNGMTVVQSISEEQDGRQWVHTSYSRKGRIPDYKDSKWVKKIFIGDSQIAISVLPKEKDHVNIHPFCLHFFTPIGFNPLPDFTAGTGSL